MNNKQGFIIVMEQFSVFRLSHFLSHCHERFVVQNLPIEVFDFIKNLTQIINMFSKFWQLKNKICQNGEGNVVLKT
jgi:hypothetical protein